jgi:hypothetical protein
MNALTNDNPPFTDSNWSRTSQQFGLLQSRLSDFTVMARQQEVRTRFGLQINATTDRSGFPGAFEGVIDPFQQLPFDPDHQSFGVGQSVCAGSCNLGPLTFVDALSHID